MKELYYWSDSYKKATDEEVEDYIQKIAVYGASLGEPFLIKKSDLNEFKESVKSGKEFKFVHM